MTIPTLILPGGCQTPHSPHPPHKWREGLFWHRTVECPGRPIVKRDFFIPEKHKHSLKLTRWNWSGNSIYGNMGPDADLTFTCLDENCDFEHQIKRWDYDQLVLKHPQRKNYRWPT